MTIKLALLAASTGVLMSIGQLLFKLGANRLSFENFSGLILQVMSSPAIILGCVLYALTIFLWLWVLSQIPLSRAYPFTALAYILTPLLSWLIFQERMNFQFVLGSVLLLAGILICASAGAGYADH